MSLDGREILIRLGAGEPIAALCARGRMVAGPVRRLVARRVPVPGPRDDRGVRPRGPAAACASGGTAGASRTSRPSDDHDLFFGFGYAIAQDRLFQLDYLRRRARGRLAEVLGAGRSTPTCSTAPSTSAGSPRTSGAGLPDGDRDLLSAYAAGVNALIDATRERPPIEFDLLDYRPEPWSPTDSLAVAAEFRWYLTGRFPVIVDPRAGQAGPRRRAALPRVPPGRGGRREHPAPRLLPRVTSDRPGRVGQTVSDPDQGHGSNNWVLSGARTTTGKPLVASDPHVPFGDRLDVARGPPAGRVVPRGGGELRRDAGRHDRPHRAGRLGRHQQHLLAPGPLPGGGRPGPPRLLPLRRPLGTGP